MIPSWVDLPPCVDVDVIREITRFKDVTISEILDPVQANGLIKGSTSIIAVYWKEKDEIVLYGLTQGCAYAITKAIPVAPLVDPPQ